MLRPPPVSTSENLSTSTPDRRPKPKITENEMDKLRSTLRQLHRDWSEEGRIERDKAYRPILDHLEAHSEQLLAEGEITSMDEFNVLVPGSVVL